MILHGEDAEDFIRKAEQNERMAKLKKNNGLDLLKSIHGIDPDLNINEEWDLTFDFIDTVPNVKKAYDVLSRHNEWRKGADIEQTNAKDLSVAIDVALACMKDVIHLSEDNFSDDDLEIK